MSIIVRFEENTKGKDFVVGDIHGCYDELMVGLEHIGFDFMKDRLFSVGDLVDRGFDITSETQMVVKTCIRVEVATMLSKNG